MSVRPLADRLLEALAASDRETVEQLSLEDVVVFGTDEGEVWWKRDALLEALEGMGELRLRVRWLGEPRSGDDWVAGLAEFTFGDGSTLEARVSMVFAAGRLAHAHYSVPSRPA